MLKVCKECGRTFETNNKAYVYCSDECRNIGHSKRKNELWHKKHPGSVKYSDNPYEAKTCVCCGKVFKPIRYNQVVCSDECRRQHKNKLQNARYEGNTWEEWVEKQREAGAEKRKQTSKRKALEKEKKARKRMLIKLLKVLSKIGMPPEEPKTYKRVCEVCGKEFTTVYEKQKTCCERCKKRRLKAKYDRRYAGITIDSGITLDAVYRRDLGVCYLCGCKCDWEDKKIVNGATVVGNRYPTVEHVIPISKGGMHCWSNVRLACFSCNTIKRDKDVAAAKQAIKGEEEAKPT